jgi:cytochrome c-type biogenesis protein CcmH/NrfF
MLGCHYSQPARERIRDEQAKGASDDGIVDAFVKERGKVSLVVPPVEGFAGLAWWTPPMVLGMGLALVYWFIRRMSRPAPVPQVEQRVLDRYKDSIEKDLASLEE